MQKRALTVAIAAIAGSLAFGTQAIAEEQNQDQSQNDPQAAQGLYSADDIIGADVYHVDDTDEEVGNVENLLLDDEGKVSAVVVSAGGVWGIGGDEVVVGVEHFTMETERDDSGTFGQDEVTHRILVDATEDELENFPSYDEQWYDDERNRRLNERGTREGVWQTTGTVGTGTVGDGREFREGESEADMGNDSGSSDSDAEYTDKDVKDEFE
jgi:hypothetical protein